MLRAVLIILLLAGYGAYALVDRLSEAAPTTMVKESDVPSSDAGSLVSGMGSVVKGVLGTVATGVTEAAGLSVLDLPNTGCQPGLLSADQLNGILNDLRPSDQQMLAGFLNASSSVWSAQFYRGEYGIGLCVPAHGLLIVLPTYVTPAAN